MQSIVRISPAGGFFASTSSAVNTRSLPEASTDLIHGILARWGSAATYVTTWLGSACQCAPVEDPSGRVPPTLSISTFVAGIPELVRAGEDGWLVPAGDVDALQRAIEACLAAPEEGLARMGEAGRERVLSRHSADVEAAKLGCLFGAKGSAWRAGERP